MPRGRGWIVAALVVMAVLAVAFGAVLTALEPSDTHSPIPRGILLIIGGLFAVIFLVIAAWVHFWHIRLIRYFGLCVVAGGVVWLLWTIAIDKIEERSQQRVIEDVRHEIDLISEGYLEQLIADPPQNALAAQSLYRAFQADRRTVVVPSGTVVFGGLEFRAVWFLYYWTFFDPDFLGFTTFYPDEDDCAVFLSAFGAKYEQIAPVPVFEDLCGAL